MTVLRRPPPFSLWNGPRAVFVCLLAWLGVFAPHLTAEELSPRELRLIVWNVRNYQEAEPLPISPESPLAKLVREFQEAPVPPPAGFYVAPRRKGSDEIALLVDTLVRLRPQVVAFVEMGPAPHFASLQQRLSAAGMVLPHFIYVAGPDTDRHLALLSAYPIREDRSVPWAEIEPAGSARYMGRGLLSAVIEPVPGVPLHLWGVHLKSQLEEDLAPETIRREEAATLRQMLLDRESSRPGVPILVFGDFNDNRASASLKHILGNIDDLEPRLDALALEDGLGDRWTHYWSAEDSYTRIDFILANKPARALVQPKASFIERYPPIGQVSDHRPLVLTLKILAPPSP